MPDDDKKKSDEQNVSHIDDKNTEPAKKPEQDPEPPQGDYAKREDFEKTALEIIKRDSEQDLDKQKRTALEPSDQGVSVDNEGKADFTGKEGEEGERGTEGESAAGEQKAEGEKAPLDDALLERAVKAGMSLADAKAVGDPDALGRIVSRLESTDKGKGGKAPESKDADADGEGEEGDADAGVKALEALEAINLDPEEYDEGVVGAIKTLKEALQGQQKIIADLKDQIASYEAPKVTWVDGEFAKLGSDWQEVFGQGNTADLPAGAHTAARAKLQRHIDFAKAEAEAEGVKLGDADAFQKALASAYGEKVTQIKGKKTQDAAKKRAATALNRPRDLNGKFARTEANDSMSDDARVQAAVADIQGYWKD